MTVNSPSKMSVRHSHFFEEFFIIGIDKNEIDNDLET
jgi:hypothetical protein